MKKKIFFSILICLLSATFIYLYTNKQNSNLSSGEILDSEDYYSSNIQPIFDSKCIACHSCYNSPCQLNMTSYFSTVRGANKVSIYDFPKLISRDPTRMFVDGEKVSTWRKKEFYTVVGTKDKSILTYMITNPHGIESGKQKQYFSEESRSCIDSVDDIEDFVKLNPAGRMPYGFPGLSSTEITQVLHWQDNGSKGPSLDEQELKIANHKGLKKLISVWESFFNRKSIKAQLSSRYIFEHLFLAHLYFPQFHKTTFRLVRSKTSKGKIVEIGTLYPFDDPQGSFSYRLRPVVETIVHKSHIPFELNEKKMKKWDESFYNSKWKVIPNKMPAYGRSGANPYKTFAAIPVESRYRFFLDESGYHIMTFIKGPVCRGQTALNVINDHFWVFFIDPKNDPMVNSESFYNKTAQKMVLPAELRDDFKPLKDLRKSYWATIKEKYQYLNTKKLSDEWLWNGDESDLDASITVSRHFDSAHVMKGLQGKTPKTMWVLDYHVFESIYYNLTAGYNVFGPILHQLNSRLFMEISRIASEDLFISFLKQDVRSKIRGEWNIAVPRDKESIVKNLVDVFTSDASEEMKYKYVFHGDKVVSSNDDTKESFLNRIKSNVLTKDQVYAKKPLLSERLKTLSSIRGEAIQYLPDTIIFSLDDEIFTLVHNKDHFNVSMLFFEQDRRNVQNDSIDIIPGIVTSYANAFIRFKSEELEDFISSLKKSKTEADINKLLKKYVISRSNKTFWNHYNFFSSHTYEKSTNEFGYLDLNRYINL